MRTIQDGVGTMAIEIEQPQEESIQQYATGKSDGFDAGYAAGYRNAMHRTLDLVAAALGELGNNSDDVPLPASITNIYKEAKENLRRGRTKFKGQVAAKEVFMSDD